MQSKNDLRNRFATQRENLELTDIAEASHQLSDKLQATLDWSKVRTILSYAPINHELDPTLFENRLKRDHPEIVIEHAIASPEALVPEKEYDVILVPCIAVDRHNYRLGNGGGWYDKLLAAQNGTSIGVVYDFAVVESLPREEHDRPVTQVVSV